MGTWAALLGGPLLALTELALAYALTGADCARQQGGLWLHAAMAVGLALALAATVAAARALRAAAPEVRTSTVPAGAVLDAAAVASRRHLLAWVGTASGALSCLVIAALWLPVLFISPCAG